MGNGKREKGNGKWEMGTVKWEMGNVKWEMGNGKWEIYFSFDFFIVVVKRARISLQSESIDSYSSSLKYSVL